MPSYERILPMDPADKPWMTSDIKAEIKLRQRAFTPSNMALYNLLRIKIEDMIRKAKSNYYQSKVYKLFRIGVRGGGAGGAAAPPNFS